MATTSTLWLASRLCLEGHSLQQSFDLHQPLVALDGEMEWLTIQLVVWGVQKGDDRPRLAEVTPRTSKHIALPPRLFRREP